MAEGELYLKVFSRATVKSLYIFKQHYGGRTFAELSRQFKITPQACQQTYKLIESKVELFTKLMKLEINRSKEIME